MKVVETEIQGCRRIFPSVHEDTRGSFVESYSRGRYNKNVFDNKIQYVQTNISESTKGVLRGLHLQKGIHAQAKLITVLRGQIMDVVVDCQQGTDTYGKVGRFILDGTKKEQLFIPDGCAHGFVALTDDVLFMYQCDEYYNKESEGGIKYDDPILDIDWILPKEQLIVSDKDKELPSWEDAYKFY